MSAADSTKPGPRRETVNYLRYIFPSSIRKRRTRNGHTALRRHSSFRPIANSSGVIVAKIRRGKFCDKGLPPPPPFSTLCNGIKGNRPRDERAEPLLSDDITANTKPQARYPSWHRRDAFRGREQTENATARMPRQECPWNVCYGKTGVSGNLFSFSDPGILDDEEIKTFDCVRTSAFFTFHGETCSANLARSVRTETIDILVSLYFRDQRF